jgi:uncharacterized protein (TIGR02996 family)
LNISIATLVELKGEHLLPADFLALAAACRDAPGDSGPCLVIADWLKEHNEEPLEFAYRWMAKWGKGPFFKEGSNKPWRWTYHGDCTLPEHARIEHFFLDNSWGDTYLESIVCLSKRILFIKVALEL